eukprot:1161974-Pelagomonas_calceolata.AAC.7
MAAGVGLLQEDLQLAAASALVSSCTFCAASIERLVQLGGFQLLLALLPLPPLPGQCANID